MKNIILPITFVALAGTQLLAQTRTETDLLGDKQIPAKALYGVQTARALERTAASISACSAGVITSSASRKKM